ncbi:MAG: T9SS type A sorting domain-containing protein [Flavobacteriales bacterium]|nr:T9SS type A sorting domain-containing protein [Bacteroidota bacterium]MCB9241816.1 T9SS type A sorting domain-containing protein [Flavobacteriales bacterium]
MRLLLTTFLFVAHGTALLAQWDTATVSTKDFVVGVDARGSLFHTGSEIRSEYPANSGKHMMNYAGLWMMGESGGTVFGAINTGEGQAECWPGPVDTITGLPTTGGSWNRVWNLTDQDVLQHRHSFNTAGYQPIEDIRDWPASHSTPNVNPILAPYIDWDLDGKYDPVQGDFPKLIGTTNAYFILNEGAGEHIVSGSPSMGIEVQGMAYTINSKALQNVVFVRYHLINRSSRNYSTFKAGLFLDFALGNANDNRIGTDVKNGFVYAYNGDLNDEGGYENQLPGAWAVFPKLTLDGSVGFSASDAVRAMPSTSEGLKNILSGKWSGGEPRTFGGKGYQTGEATNFLYSGSTDDQISGFWADSTSGDAPGTRNVLMIHNFNGLNSGEYVTLDVAIGVGLENGQPDAQRTQSVWTILNEFNVLGVDAISQNLGFRLYPNPVTAGEIITVDAGEDEIIQLQLTDFLGRVVWESGPDEKKMRKITIPCSDALPDGVYQMNMKTTSTISSHKVLIHRR